MYSPVEVAASCSGLVSPLVCPDDLVSPAVVNEQTPAVDASSSPQTAVSPPEKVPVRVQELAQTRRRLHWRRRGKAITSFHPAAVPSFGIRPRRPSLSYWHHRRPRQPPVLTTFERRHAHQCPNAGLRFGKKDSAGGWRASGEEIRDLSFDLVRTSERRKGSYARGRG